MSCSCQRVFSRSCNTAAFRLVVASEIATDYSAKAPAPAPALSLQTCRSFATSRHYEILGVGPASTITEIKTAFRQLAKTFHPDLNFSGNDDAAGASDKMAQLIQAYEAVLTDDNHADRINSKVALACELHPLGQLQTDTRFLIQPVRIIFPVELQQPQAALDNYIAKDNGTINNGTAAIDTMALTTESILQIETHPDDSVSDLKESVQPMIPLLENRRRDRYGLAAGWEVITSGWPDQTILGNHFFLSEYNIQHHDLLYAVIQK